MHHSPRLIALGLSRSGLLHARYLPIHNFPPADSAWSRLDAPESGEPQQLSITQEILIWARGTPVIPGAHCRRRQDLMSYAHRLVGAGAEAGG